MKTLLILSDGMRPDCIEQHSLVKDLKKKSTYSLNAQTVMPSVTLPTHMSLFHSVGPERHGITTNIYVPQVRPIPGLCEVLKQAGKKCAMLYDWEPLRDLSRPSSLFRSEFYSGGQEGGYYKTDPYLCKRAKELLKGKEVDFTFLYLGLPDSAGHGSGWCSDMYMQSVNRTYDLIADVIEHLYGEYTIILTSDHGGHDRIHGTDLTEDMTIPVFFLGHPFEEGKEISGVSILDIAPTIVDLLGAEIPKEWEGRIIR